MVEEHSDRKIDARRPRLLGLDPRTGCGHAQRGEGSLFSPLGDGTVTRRDFLMATNAALLGAIAAARPGSAQPPDLPLLVDGLQGWVSTTQGQFLFGDGTTAPGHGKAVREARNLQNQQPLFSQATAELRPTWDAATFDVPCIRSDGTRYLTRSTALAAPGLVIVGCAFDGGSTGFRALTGARSTQTPGGDPAEDSWTLNKSSTNELRALVATDTEVDFADTPAILGEKLLVLMEVVGNTLQVWQAGSTGEQTIVGTRIVADGEQALLAKYFDDAITAILEGSIFEFAQYAPAPSRDVRRLLVQYFQGLIWPAVPPPIAATVDAGQVQRGASTSINVVAPSSGSSLVLASIDEQPAAGSFSVVGDSVSISVPAGAATGNYSGYYCLRSDVPGSRLVDFGQVNFDVVQATEVVDLPFAGKFYGNHSHFITPNNEPMKSTSDRVSWFFYAPRSGTVNRFRWNRRTDVPAEGYSDGDGGTYTCQIWPANATTKLPITTGTPLARLTNYSPGNSGVSGQNNSSPPLTGGTLEYPVMTFSQVNAPLVAGQPYCFEWVPTGANQGANFVSMNGFCAYIFDDEVGPNTYATNFMPDFIEDTIVSGREFPYPVVAKNIGGNLTISWRKGMGDPSVSLRYSDGIWFGAPSIAQGDTTRYALIGGNNEARDRRRVALANRVVDGVWIRISRNEGATGDLLVRLEDHGTSGSDTSGNGTLMGTERTVSASSLYELPNATWPTNASAETINETSQSAPFDQAPWVFVPFGQQHTLVVGRIYNLRFRKPSGAGNYIWKTPQGAEHGAAQWSPVAANWADHEANNQISWHDKDSRGIQVSTDGTNWSFYGGNLRCRGPIVYRCV